MNIDIEKIAQMISQARKGKNYSIEYVHEQTCIPVDYLTAFEEGKLPDLPETYIIAFLRTLFKVLELPEELLRSHAADYSQSETIDTDIPVSGVHSKRVIRIISGVFLVFLLVLTGIYIFRFNELFNEPSLSDNDFFINDTARVSASAEKRNQYIPDSLYIQNIRALNPNVVLYLYYDAEDDLSREMLNSIQIIINELDSQEIVLNLNNMPSDELSDEALSNYVQVLPTCIVMYDVIELGRMIGKPSVSVEERLYEIFKRADFLKGE